MILFTKSFDLSIESNYGAKPNTPNIHEVECGKLKYKDNKDIVRELHSVLTYKLENKESGCINRDKNAVNNMRRIVKHLIKYKERPIPFQRKSLSTPKRVK